MIQINHLHKKFGTNEVLKGISLNIEQGETVTILGPSGSGKSTLLRCLNLLEIPTSGTIQIDDLSFTAPKIPKKTTLEVRRNTAMVFQNYNLFNNLNVIDNITSALITVQKKTKQEATTIARDLLEKVGLLEKELAYPHSLSGGQKQRIAIARALALNPKVILFDEPTSALDPELVDEVLNVIRNVVKQKITAIIVTHELDFASNVSDRVVLMDKGVIVEQNNAHDFFHNPQHERTKKFLEKFKADPIEYYL